MEKMDKLFNEKLASYERTPPVGAWTKIENNLDGNSRGLWLKIAAGLSAIAIVSFVLVKTMDDNTNDLANDKENTQSNEESPTIEKHDQTPVAKSEVPVTKEDSRKDLKVADQDKPSEKTEHEPIKAIVPIDNENIAAIEQDTVTGSVTTTENIPETSQNSVAVAETTEVEEPVLDTDNAITIVYSAEEVNSKYLNKDAATEATSDDKKPSTLRKLLEKAYDLKHNQDAFGGLRQKKNEILALNFKNEKERSQNR